MAALSLKPTHKPVKDYYAALQRFTDQGVKHEGAVKSAFQGLLETCAGKRNWLVVPEWEIRRPKQHPLRVDAALIDEFKIPHGFWEAKDTQDDLDREVRKKFDLGYPQDNILFQAPNRALLFQNRERILDADLTKPEALIDTLNAFFAYTPPAFEQWDKAVSEFQQRVPELGQGLKDIIEAERKVNTKFVAAFTEFAALCRASLNPNLRDEAVEEMLIQHLLTERLFRTVFNNADFVRRNAIAQQIERVIDALASKSFSRAEFLRKLDRFYRAIEDTAATITDFSQKQKFLNTVYEKFFQGFCVKVADTLGIVYTPPPIVRFMVASVEHLLIEHFGKSLGSANVHILDPFAGTDNFHVHLMQRIPKTALPHKFAHEFWTNEIMLLPYYIGCMNIEHAYYEATGEYLAFPGACLVDTFETAEKTQHEFGFMTQENVERVKRQKAAPIFVVISNPPYNAWQANENDNNKNRKYPIVDGWVSKSYGADSKATLQNSLRDPYIKAIRWASNRIGDEGIVAFVTNSGFIDGIACDGMRKNLAQDFSHIIHIDLKGNARTTGERRRREGGNVFDEAIRVGVGVTFFIRTKDHGKKPAQILIWHAGDRLSGAAKRALLERAGSVQSLPLESVTPSSNYIWITEGLSDEFATFVPLGSKERAGEAIFKVFSNGVKSNGDAYAFNFDRARLVQTAERMVDVYDTTLDRWRRKGQPKNLEAFLEVDEKVLKWIRHTKRCLLRGQEAAFNPDRIRTSLYRPFTKQFHFFERLFNEDLYHLPQIFPNASAENENRLICTVTEQQIPFSAQIASYIPCLHYGGRQTQCYPFYTYTEDGSERQENITDWALEQFRQRYSDDKIGKWEIFHYVYAVLHHPEYREKYAANLRRELPRIPFVGAVNGRSGGPRSVVADADVFWEFAAAGKQLAELHVGYEQQPEYPLQKIEAKDVRLNWRIEKMRLSKDKASLRYNDFLTLAGIPKEAFDYRLGNRSALDWVIDQYQVSTDKRSGITNDPNRPDDEQYIVRLIAQVITVSVETAKIVKALPALS